MSQYMILIYGDESAWETMPPEQAQAGYQAYMEYNRDLAASGVLKSGAQLAPSSTGTTLRGSGRTIAVHDGPFAESKEQLGGYYILECATRAEAVEWARRCPAAAYGAVEVRELGTIAA